MRPRERPDALGVYVSFVGEACGVESYSCFVGVDWDETHRTSRDPHRAVSGKWDLGATVGALLICNNKLYYDALMKHDHEPTRAGVDWEGRRSSDEALCLFALSLDTLQIIKLKY